MISLKAFLPVLSQHTDLSVTALYERQRALVRLGLLPAPSKSGRNSGGARATPGSVAVMLLSVLVTDRLSEMDERILEFLSLQAYPLSIQNPRGKRGHCPFTGERTLYRALQATLAGQTTGIMTEISVDRRRKVVELSDANPENQESCIFGVRPETGNQIRHLVSFGGLYSLEQELWSANNPETEKLPISSASAINRAA